MLTRRQFLESGCAVAAVSGAASLLSDAQADSSSVVPEYRALVCIALGGGADSYNMLVPADAPSYSTYTKRRANLALGADMLLPLGRSDDDGRCFALHHGLRELHDLYSAGDIALLANAGPLPGASCRASRVQPPDLSHTDFIARWHLGGADQRLNSGWAGRAADVLADYGRLGQLPTNISMSGRNAMQLGLHTAAVDLRSGPYRRPVGLPVGVDFSYLNEQLAQRALGAGRPWSMPRRTRRLEQAEAEGRAIVESAVRDVPAFGQPFAPDSFSTELEQVARLIAARSALGSRRQIFFVHFDGWDHHHKLLESQAMMLPTLSRGLAAFRDALIEHDVFDDVTTFTISEFGRCLESNGSGSDHGWGGHHIVMGGAVRGGCIYGHYPDLASGSPLDVGGGSFVPTTSMEEYLAELTLWLGTPVVDLPHVLPDLAKFWSARDRTPPLGMLV